MKSLVKAEVVDKLNDLIQRMFYLNAVSDNIAYSLEYKGYHDTSNIFHEGIAHRFPAWSDFISDFMYELGVRAVRKGIPDQTEEYEDIKAIFDKISSEFIGLADYIDRLIEEMDFDYKNRYIVIKLENLLEMIQPYIRVVETWRLKAFEYTKHDNLYKFDKDFHTFISLPE